jgi:hypothetical protein
MCCWMRSSGIIHSRRGSVAGKCSTNNSAKRSDHKRFHTCTRTCNDVVSVWWLKMCLSFGVPRVLSIGWTARSNWSCLAVYRGLGGNIHSGNDHMRLMLAMITSSRSNSRSSGIGCNSGWYGGGLYPANTPLGVRTHGACMPNVASCVSFIAGM